MIEVKQWNKIFFLKTGTIEQLIAIFGESRPFSKKQLELCIFSDCTWTAYPGGAKRAHAPCGSIKGKNSLISLFWASFYINSSLGTP